MQVNTEIWGAPENAYTGFNQRGGTSDINDPDFTDFPPISLCTYNDAATYKQLLYQWINSGKLSLDDEIDKSICYVGMYNSDLPQLNIVGLYNNTKNTLEDPLYKTDNTQIQSFIFTGITNYNEFADRLDWGPSQLYTDTYITYDYRLRRYKGGIIGSAPNVSPQGNANCNGFLNVFQNFGVKCFILEINVKYKTGTDSNGVTTSTYTLKEYAEQTTAWKTEHPIVTAYCRPFWRADKNGTYSYTKPSGYFCELMPVFTLPYKSNANDITDNISYHTNVCRTTATRTGYFPIYGAIMQELETSASAVAIQEQGRAALLIGANRGILNSITSGGSKRYWLELDGTDDNIEYIRRGAAAYGMFFCDDIGNLAASGGDVLRWIDDKMCLGIVDENGLTNGDYSHGIQNALQRNFAWSTINDSDYDPSLPPIPQNDYNTTTVFNSIGDTATMFKRYVINDTNVKQLGRDLFKISTDFASTYTGEDYTKYVNSSFLVSDPLDSIVTLQRFPMSIPRDTDQPENIKLGTNDCNAIGYPMSKTCYEYAFTGKKIYPKFGDSFLDYAPYTVFEMYIPFCGTIPLEPKDILNRELSARLIVDFATGTCTGYVLSDNLVIATVNGNIAIDIPVTGINAATIAGELNNAIANSKSAYNNKMSAGFNLAKSIMSPLSWGSGKTVGATATAINAETAESAANYDLTHQMATPHVIGAASPCGAWAIDLTCRLIIYYPTGDVIRQVGGLPQWDNIKLSLYGQTIGFATCEPNNINAYSGLVTAVKPTLSNITTSQGLPATATELAMIEQAMLEGIII